MNERDQRVLAELDPKLRTIVNYILLHVNAKGKLPKGIVLRPHTGYRSAAAQLLAYARGVSKLKRGKHNEKPARACDLVFCVDGRWSWGSSLPYWLIGYWAEKASLTWGGRWGTPHEARNVIAHSGMEYGWDPCHVELP